MRADFGTGKTNLGKLGRHPTTQNNTMLGLSDYPDELKIHTLNPDTNLISTMQQSKVESSSDINFNPFGNIKGTRFVLSNQRVLFDGLDTTTTFMYNDYAIKINSIGTPLCVSFVEDITV